jgi:hypothetical protein
LAAMDSTLNILLKSWCVMRKYFKSMKAHRRYFLLHKSKRDFSFFRYNVSSSLDKYWQKSRRRAVIAENMRHFTFF